MANPAAKVATGKAATKVKKRNKNVPIGCLYIYASFNNTIVTLTDLNGDALAHQSAGGCGFRGSRKSTPYAAQVAGEFVAKIAKDEFKTNAVDVYVRGPGPGRESAIRAFAALGINIRQIIDITGIPFNGCRAPKERRV